MRRRNPVIVSGGRCYDCGRPVGQQHHPQCVFFPDVVGSERGEELPGVGPVVPPEGWPGAAPARAARPHECEIEDDYCVAEGNEDCPDRAIRVRAGVSDSQWAGEGPDYDTMSQGAFDEWRRKVEGNAAESRARVDRDEILDEGDVLSVDYDGDCYDVTEIVEYVGEYEDGKILDDGFGNPVHEDDSPEVLDAQREGDRFIVDVVSQSGRTYYYRVLVTYNCIEED